MELPVKTPVFSSRKTPYRIETKNLSYKTSNTYVLKDVTCKIEPAELTAIAGPSGAGKTTLLEILAGKTSPRNPSLSGQVLVNGCPLDAKIFRRVSGYVTQDDALFPLLTVEETLMYSALLKLPCGKREAATRVKSLINELGLELVAGSRVGEGSTSGISGGERRRVSIGVELVHDPPIVLIDEPTSGLDSASALHVVALLKLMTIQKFKTIVLTIHQPGFRILELFDRLVLLSDGNVIHNGSLKLLEERLKISGHFIPPHINVLEFAIDVACGLTIQTTETNHTKFFTNGRNGQTEGINIENRALHNSIFDEVVILGERSCKNIFRTKQLFATRVIQALFTGFTLGTIFMNVGDDQRQIALQARIGFFAFSLTFLLSSTTEALPIFLQERGILMRETSRGAYRVFSYVFSSTLIFLPFLLLVSLLYATPVYWLIGLRREADRFLYFTLVVWMVMLMSNSFTACFSALLPDFIMGNSVISGLMGCFFLFSGYFISKENLPKYWIFMHYLSMFKYPFECFMINEYGGKQEGRCLVSERGECNLNGEVFLRQQGLEESQKWSNLAVMLAFIVGYRVICFLILWYRCYRTRN